MIKCFQLLPEINQVFHWKSKVTPELQNKKQNKNKNKERKTKTNKQAKRENTSFPFARISFTLILNWILTAYVHL